MLDMEQKQQMIYNELTQEWEPGPVMAQAKEIDPNQHPIAWMLWAIQDENAGLQRDNALLMERQRIMECDECDGSGNYEPGNDRKKCEACNGTGSRIIQLEREAAKWKTIVERERPITGQLEAKRDELEHRVSLLKVANVEYYHQVKDLKKELRSLKKASPEELKKRKAERQKQTILMAASKRR